MTTAAGSRLRAAKHRALALLLQLELCGAESEAPDFPRRAAALLREAARVCLSAAQALGEMMEGHDGECE